MPAIVFAGSSSSHTEEVGCLRFSFVFLSYTLRMAFVCFSSFNTTRRRYQEYITVVCRNAKFLWLWGWNIDTSSPRLKQLKWPYRILCLPAFDMGRTLEVSLQSSIVNGMKWNDTLIEAKENVCRIVWLVAYAAGQLPSSILIPHSILLLFK